MSLKVNAQGRGAHHVPAQNGTAAARAGVGRDQRAARRPRPSRRCASAGTTRGAGASTATVGTGGASRTAAGRTTGPQLAMLVAACKAPDGTLLGAPGVARRLPLLGVRPVAPGARGTGSCTSRIGRGRPAVLEVYPNWTYGGAVAGRLRPLHVPRRRRSTASARTPKGVPKRQVRPERLHRHAQLRLRAGWKRESGILTHRRTGTFCHSFVPQRPFAGYPSQELRPAGARRAAPCHRGRAGRHADRAGRGAGLDASPIAGATPSFNAVVRPRHGGRHGLRARAIELGAA